MSTFKFKKFNLTHRNDVFKFGTDAALLGVWVDLSKAKNVLEIGTGSGVISFMMAQRVPSALYTGIDISSKAINLAIENLHSYPIKSTINFIESSIQEFHPSVKFDTIVSNPPFFEKSTKSPSELKNTTRHTDNLSLLDLLSHSKRLLSEHGVIYLIYPIRYLEDLKSICSNLKLYPIQITSTRSSLTKPFKRILISIGNQETAIKSRELIINGDSHGYSEEVYNMLKPFLLKL